MVVLQHRFLVYHEDRNEVIFMGYPLALSPTERAIVVALLRNVRCDMDSLVGICDGKPNRKSIPVHINAINHKAAEISGRRLISFDRGSYHFLSRM